MCNKWRQNTQEWRCITCTNWSISSPENLGFRWPQTRVSGWKNGRVTWGCRVRGTRVSNPTQSDKCKSFLWCPPCKECASHANINERLKHAGNKITNPECEYLNPNPVYAHGHIRVLKSDGCCHQPGLLTVHIPPYRTLHGRGQKNYGSRSLTSRWMWQCSCITPGLDAAAADAQGYYSDTSPRRQHKCELSTS